MKYGTTYVAHAYTCLALFRLSTASGIASTPLTLTLSSASTLTFILSQRR
jgi:hypothetical protein